MAKKQEMQKLKVAAIVTSLITLTGLVNTSFTTIKTGLNRQDDIATFIVTQKDDLK